MTSHLLVPCINLEEIKLIDEYEEWLIDWINQVDINIDNSEVSSSMCILGLLIELIINKKPCRDWDQIFNDLLTDSDGKPLSYSENYGKKLYKFDQWKQSTVHAIYNNWWTNRFFNEIDHSTYSDQIISCIQDNGWIYNPEVSPTRIRNRMKSELIMSLAMSLEILISDDKLSPYKELLQANCISEPITGYISAEYFRIKSLSYMESTHLKPSNLELLFEACQAGEGYCDFSMESKTDDYMGSAKRSSRDKPVHSAISTLQAYFISLYVDEETKIIVTDRISNFVEHLNKNPFDIPSFQIRDICIPFGDDITPLELISAGALMTLTGDL